MRHVRQPQITRTLAMPHPVTNRGDRSYRCEPPECSVTLVGFNCEDGYERRVVVLDDRPDIYIPRKVLEALGYMNIRVEKCLRTFLTAYDILNVNALLIIDLGQPDEEGYPIPKLKRAPVDLCEVACVFVEKSRLVKRLRIDYIVLPPKMMGKTLLRVTCRRGLCWVSDTGEGIQTVTPEETKNHGYDCEWMPATTRWEDGRQ